MKLDVIKNKARDYEVFGPVTNNHYKIIGRKYDKSWYIDFREDHNGYRYSFTIYFDRKYKCEEFIRQWEKAVRNGEEFGLFHTDIEMYYVMDLSRVKIDETL